MAKVLALQVGDNMLNNMKGLTEIGLGSIKKNTYNNYQRKYKFKPTGTMNSSRGGTVSKPPLGTINGSVTSAGVTSKYNRSRDEPLSSNRDTNSGSFRSIDNTNENSQVDPSIRSYISDAKRSVAAKLSSTLPKSSAYKKYTGSSNYKAYSYHKKQSSGNKIQVYSNSHRDYNKSSYSSALNNSQNNSGKVL